MNKARKNVSKWLGMMLAVAMVFSLNLTSMTAKAATTIPVPKSADGSRNTQRGISYYR